MYGMYCRTSHSARSIPRFIERYNVDMTGCDDSYRSYADFFSRGKEGIAFPTQPNVLGSPCEGLASAYADIDMGNLIAVKGSSFSLSELFNDETLASKYDGGSMLKIRLTPTNYHRVHFFDDGTITASKRLRGSLHSVNPLALRRVARLYCRNKRALIMMSSRNFGDVVFVEVGATFVGSIVHCFEDGESVSRESQASYFLPGGSLLLVFFQKGVFEPGETLLKHTADGYETKVAVGEPLGIGVVSNDK